MKNLSIRVFQLFLCLLLSSGLGLAAHAVPPDYSGMTALSDEQLGDVTGQALLMMDSRPGQGISSGLNFYKVGLDAAVDLNLNIAKLQLGCGGVNGPGCDIDIDRLSLSGNCDSGRPGCSASLTRPFFEFAIDENQDSGLREIVGFRLSAEMAEGLLTAGENNGIPNGINSLSGYLNIAGTSGRARTAAAEFREVLSGRLCVTVFGGCLAPADFTTNDSPLKLPSMPVNFDVAGFEAYGSRMQSVQIGAKTTISGIPFSEASGSRKATALGITLNKVFFTTQLNNLNVDIQIDQDLGMVHRIPVANPFSLSMQSRHLLWPDAPVAAERGWWLAFSDPINIGELNAADNYEVDISSVFPDVAVKISDYLTKNRINVSASSVIGGVFGGDVKTYPSPIDLSNYSAAQLSISDIPLGAVQNVTPNCWGNSRFC